MDWRDGGCRKGALGPPVSSIFTNESDPLPMPELEDDGEWEIKEIEDDATHIICLPPILLYSTLGTYIIPRLLHLKIITE